MVGVRRVIEAGKKAEEKGLSLVAGTMHRRQDNFVQGVKRVRDGVMGQPITAQAFYLTSSIWLRERKSGMSDMEWQCRNWYYFTWLSGDYLVEQFVHNLDTMNWIFQGHPVKAVATRRRQARIGSSYGHIYDHFSAVYTYPNGIEVRAMCRQMEMAQHNVSNRVVGSQGMADINPGETTIASHDGETLFQKVKGETDPYVVEHTDLIESIRQDEPLNEAKQVAHSAMAAILGREAAYTGKSLTWEEVMAADQLDLGPESYKFGSASLPAILQPGRTTLQRSW